VKLYTKHTIVATNSTPNMVFSSLRAAIPGVPNPLPSNSNPDERRRRKEYEKEHPHFQMQEFGLKAGVLGLMAVVALLPWEKQYEEHVKREHPERLEKGRSDEERREKGKRRAEGRERQEERSTRGYGDSDSGSRRSERAVSVGGRRSDRGSAYTSQDSRRDRRRMSVQEPPSTRYRAYPDERSRRASVAPASESGRRRAPADDVRSRRRSVDSKALRMAVAEGYEYIPPHRGYVEEKGGMDDGWDTRSKRVSADEYAGRERRGSVR